MDHQFLTALCGSLIFKLLLVQFTEVEEIPKDNFKLALFLSGEMEQMNYLNCKNISANNRY